MKILMGFLIFLGCALATFISLAPSKATSQKQLFKSEFAINSSYAKASTLSGGSFFVIPIKSMDARLSVADLNPDYLIDSVESNLSEALKATDDRFGPGDLFVIPVVSGVNNLCFISDQGRAVDRFIANRSNRGIDDYMVVHELGHCQYRFSSDGTEFNDDVLGDFAQYVMREAVNKPDRFRVTAANMGDDYLDVYQEAYADLFSIGYYYLNEGDENIAQKLIEYRNDGLTSSRDLTHWTTPLIRGFVEKLKTLDSAGSDFETIHHLVMNHLTSQRHAFTPEMFLNLMVVVGRSEIANRDHLQKSDFVGSRQTLEWVNSYIHDSGKRIN